jgi:hypothetical protein
MRILLPLTAPISLSTASHVVAHLAGQIELKAEQNGL